jgi:hypothetical protein
MQIASVEDVVTWVKISRVRLEREIMSVVPEAFRCVPEDFEDLLCDAYPIAIEAFHLSVNESKDFIGVFISMYRMFLSKVPRPGSVWDMDIDDFEENHPFAAAKEDSDCACDSSVHDQYLSTTFRNVCSLLSPMETELFLLLVGESAAGSCDLYAAASELGIKGNYARVVFSRIEEKAQRALKVFSRDGVHFYDDRSFDKRRTTPSPRPASFAMQRAV